MAAEIQRSVQDSTFLADHSRNCPPLLIAAKNNIGEAPKTLRSWETESDRR